MHEQKTADSISTCVLLNRWLTTIAFPLCARTGRKLINIYNCPVNRCWAVNIEVYIIVLLYVESKAISGLRILWKLSPVLPLPHCLSASSLCASARSVCPPTCVCLSLSGRVRAHACFLPSSKDDSQAIVSCQWCSWSRQKHFEVGERWDRRYLSAIDRML